MNKKALWKDIWREVWQTKSRFFSILALIMLGVAFFAGLKATGPNMLLTANQYYTDYGLTDNVVQSTYGLDETDEAALKKTPGVKRVEMQYTADLLLKQNKAVMRLYSYTETQKVNQYQVESGRLPEKSGEVALDATEAMKKDFKIGDKVTFVKNNGAKPSDTLKRDTYTVVGFVNSPMFIETSGRGTSSIGKGKTDAIVVVPKQDFDMSVYTQANLTFTNTAGEAAFSDAYNEAADANEKQIEKVLDTQADKRFTKIQNDAKAKIADGEQKWQDGRAELAENQAKLDAAKQELDSGFAKYKTSKAEFDAQMQTSEAELAKGREKLRVALQNMTDAKAKIATGDQEIKQAKEQLAAGRADLDAAQAELDAKRAALVQMEGAANEAAKAQLEAANQKLAAERAKLDAAEKTLATKQAELDAAKAKLVAGEKEYAAGVAELNAGEEKLRSGRSKGERELNAALAKLNAGQAEYEANLATFNTEKKKAEAELADAEQDLQIAKEKLADMEKPKYYVLDRSSYPGYNEYNENTERLTSLSTAFPAFFFLIAALVCLTTMTRMVEEQRTFIGTYKALGYNNTDIMKKFLVYGSLASLVGTVLGLLVGFQLFPNVIFNAYGTMYKMPPIEIAFYPSYSIIGLIVALVCTTVTAFVACYAELKASAATLMRPKAPKKGKRILLERVTPIWKRMRFSDKVTARNIFRYKQRMLMTVIGVAGCTALILTGFGLRDSISDIATLQYGNIMKYDALVSRDTTATKTQNTEYEKLMQDINITARKSASLNAMDAIQTGKNQSVNVTAFESTADLNDFIVLRDRKTHAAVPLSNNGVVITEKLADLFDLQAGDALTVRDANNEEHQLKVTGIAENYAGHYAYMTKSYYTKIFHEAPKYNTDLLNLKDTSQKTENRFAEKLIDDGAALQVTYSNTISSLLTDTLDSLNVVMIVLIVSAAILAFIVLYNLTNINVSERIRELSTIKVLGFYPKEVTLYVYRENIILSMMGILGGFVLGFFLHQYVITTAEIDNMMFSPMIRWPSYLYSAILTLVFSTIVMLVMHVKLKRIDMIEALKSVE
ncbi:FtsX-like permease family protein [Listeria sp. ILCC792]|uniref:FtsX-like permease family protein n=1 Tax=Listeria sp. ILCC792 TaxID=1918331 RepID=UPI000B592515|nr:FtsX-like permease family protein [Listeria sp. ILCC792]